MTIPASGLQIRSEVRADGTLHLSLVDEPTRAPGPNDVLVRIEAAPLNPSDLGLLFGGADMTTATASGTAGRPEVTATLPPAAGAMRALRPSLSLLRSDCRPRARKRTRSA